MQQTLFNLRYIRRLGIILKTSWSRVSSRNLFRTWLSSCLHWNQVIICGSYGKESFIWLVPSKSRLEWLEVILPFHLSLSHKNKVSSGQSYKGCYDCNCDYKFLLIKIMEQIYKIHHTAMKHYWFWVVAVAQLVERSLPIPEVRSSNPVIGKNLFNYIEHLLTVNCESERRK